MCVMIIIPSISIAADSNTVATTSSTVSTVTSGTVTGTTTVDRTPSTAMAPNVIINNQDVCVAASS